MGLRKLDEDTKVTKMKIVPSSEKQDATRSVISSALDSCAVKEGMVGWRGQKVSKSGQCTSHRGAQAYIRARSESWQLGLGRIKGSRDIGNINYIDM